MATNTFYKKAASYWAKVPATIDGVLGGFGHISDIDINGSKAFLEKVFAQKNPPGTKLALDCGAGIGRITKLLLMPRFDKVDLVEQDEKFITAVKQFIGKDKGKLGMLYHNALQNFNFELHKKYDVIWCQWILGHLNDCDLITFLNKCRLALAHDGVIVIKENITASAELDYDATDSSVTRPLHLMKEIFDDVKLKVVLTDIQKDFPDDLYPVHLFVLVPFEQAYRKLSDVASFLNKL